MQMRRYQLERYAKKRIISRAESKELFWLRVGPAAVDMGKCVIAISLIYLFSLAVTWVGRGY